jgi:RHS repeat-associated protein
VWTYVWNGAGLLDSVTTPEGTIVEFAYDPFARRVQKRVKPANEPPSTVRFVWDQDVLVHEVARSAEVETVKTYCFEDDSYEPRAQRARMKTTDEETEGEWLEYINDPIGTPERLVDARGTVVCDLQREPWGTTEVAPGARATTPLRFQGQYEDEETGEFYNLFRYYSPWAKSYLSADPAGLDASANFFYYCKNPITWVDPFGLATNTPNTGVVYLRTDPKTGKEYVGKSKSKEAYAKRQAAHKRKCGQQVQFQKLQDNIPEKDLAQSEENWIRAGGGPGGKPGQTGPLANKIHGQAAAKYNGPIPFP